MIAFEEFTLENGLRVIVHEDPTVQIAVLNILYDVGSRDEHPDKTGFAHLFEHLMFGGSKNIPNYDEPLQKVGGENNAFTNTDITNYYLTVPAANIETGFWLESDRMLSLSFDPQVLEVQRKVVIEEFKQRYLNQPYGDVWLRLRPLTYLKHPYQWATIGKEISHIENATMDDVRGFFFKHYSPDNAILVVAGNVKLDQVKKLSEKWFGPIPAQNSGKRNLPVEPTQTLKRTLEIEAKVPASALYKAYHMPGRFTDDYYASDLLSDVLSRGQSSRLYRKLVKEKEIFTSISSFVMGTIDPGLLVINGRVKDGVDLKAAEREVDQIVQEIVRDGATPEELDKVKNQAYSTLEFGEVEVMNRAMNLAFAKLSGDTNLVNEEGAAIEKVSLSDIKRVADNILREENSSVMYYKAKIDEMKIRVGMGFDVHPLAKGRELFLGGIKLDAERGAVGHSDADVLIHAICDALLGAANLRDIGFHFANTDDRWKGADSRIFLKEVTRMLHEKGWRVENVDCTLTLEKPKVNPHIPAMKKVLAPLMDISEDDVSIKATTNEKLGYVGREEGVNAYAVALISKS